MCRDSAQRAAADLHFSLTGHRAHARAGRTKAATGDEAHRYIRAVRWARTAGCFSRLLQRWQSGNRLVSRPNCSASRIAPYAMVA